MTTILLVIHIVLVAALIGIVLIQKNEGGGLGMGGGGSMGGFMSARGTANFLTRTTGILATLFFVSSLCLALVFKGGERKKSILKDGAQVAVTAAPLQAGQTNTSSAPAGKVDESQKTPAPTKPQAPVKS